MDNVWVGEILNRMAWDQPIEVQDMAVKEVVGLPGLDLSPFLQPISTFFSCGGKCCWDNCAKVFRLVGYPRCGPYLDGLFRWISDMNWPGAVIVEELLLSLPRDIFMKHYENAIRFAYAEDDTPWLFILSLYVVIKRITESDFTDPNHYSILKPYPEEARELIKRMGGRSLSQWIRDNE